MHEKTLLIVGIDPGTTTAYAVLDLEGNVLKTHAQKDIDLGDVIKAIIR
ncbi:DUF460 domain-containing protein [Candidatus Woesearchaeota archaeon]|nr:DUF460 domain-containing protein [Candidatus Woesearchaeota archaeon]